MYVLPAIHLAACGFSLLTYLLPSNLQFLGIVWEFIAVADLPISLVFYGVAWQHGTVAILWIVVAGTLWWYFLSRVAGAMISEVRHNKAISIVNRSNGEDIGDTR